MSGRNRRSGVFGAGMTAGLCFVLLGGALALSLCVGAKKITFSELAGALFAFDPGNKNHVILRTLRIPRTFAAAAVGSSLAVSGSLMQAATRNPMASPSVLGINAGAGLGLALAMIVCPAAPLM